VSDGAQRKHEQKTSELVKIVNIKNMKNRREKNFSVSKFGC
jgi:hypothetical protein